MEIIRSQIDVIEPSTISALCGQSFFSSQQFMNLWETVGGNPVYWTIQENDRIVGLYPGVEFGAAGLKRFQSMPDGLYGKLFLDSSIETASVYENLLQAISKAGYIKIFLFDYYRQFEPARGYATENLQTILVDISDKNWQPPDKKLQAEIRKAEREYVQVKIFNKDKHFDRFLELMYLTEKRHKRKPKYPDKFYEKLADIAADDQRILWYWCQHESKAVSSHINFIENDMIINWQVFFDKEYSFLKANQKIIFEMTKELQNCEIKTLNLGGSPDKAESLIDYKLKWGGADYTYQVLMNKSLIGKMV